MKKEKITINPDEINRVIETILDKKNISMSQLAELVGTQKQNVYNWKTGRTKISIKLLQKIVATLNGSVKIVIEI